MRNDNINLDSGNLIAKKLKNYAFIDGQNLYLGTTKSTPSWIIDLKRFRILLKQRYGVDKAYYFLGYYDKSNSTLYKSLRNDGYILFFRMHSGSQVSLKKGNVDGDIIFTVMKNLCEKEAFDKVVLVSGDGDYKRMVDYLIEKDKLLRILFPNSQASILYRKLEPKYYEYLNSKVIINKIKK